ncbi:protein DOWNY MILDEW RESISTANCE 6-like [Senna tora]|uniref:Protein DOWNY MILDEW RESISTANCE 6-like n=1 Tax=Senna tora TaxID=362788 RepID=A0A834TJQ5_9FABA|nr:protein DOWNY MILDEW RESISTANCE 6-like [Senna tora]
MESNNMGEMLVSSWFHLHPSVPASYVQPPESQPGEQPVASGKTIPVIDLGGHHDHEDTLNLILKASQEYGFFQVINHGVCEELIKDTLKIFKEFHGMDPKEKMKESSKDPNGTCKLYTSREVSKEEIVGKYTQELRRLGLKILKMIAKGLGLKEEYFNGSLSENPLVLAHHYPPCPEPSLTLGAPKHRDPSLITFLLQDDDEAIHYNALQVFKDGQWIGVDPIPNAFVVNVGHLLEIISNGRLIGAEHRVVTNASSGRTTVAYFINPTEETVIEPAKALINATTPPFYPSISYTQFRRDFLSQGNGFGLKN